MILQNSSGEPITELYVQPSTSHKEDMRRLTIEGASEVTEGQNADGDMIEEILKYNVRLFRFDPPLKVGKRVELDFEAFFHAPRFADRSVISKNGTFLNNYANFGSSSRVIPIFGPINYLNSLNRALKDLIKVSLGQSQGLRTQLILKAAFAHTKSKFQSRRAI